VTQSVVSVPRVDLDAIRIRYATYRDLDGDARAALAASLAAPAAMGETTERVLVETCHRVELVSVGIPAQPQARGPAEATGADAVRRVFEVVAGFDSAVVAEEQLLGQVRGAYEAALDRGESGPILNELFRRALRFGRRVRTHARPGTDRSLADPSAAWLLERLPPRSRVVAAGTGEMGRLLAHRLADAGHRIRVVSRSAERGGSLLEQLPGDGHDLVVGSMTDGTLRAVDGLALAVRTREPMLDAAVLGAARPWVLDLSAPPAVAADAREVLAERLMTLDELGQSTATASVLEPAVERRLRTELEREVERFVVWLDARDGGDAIAVLRREADAVRRRHLDRLRSRAGLDDEQLAAVDAASAAMLGELLHGPSVELRRGGADAATIRRLFGLSS
jgi:glutamyl-tRNA reductase